MPGKSKGPNDLIVLPDGAIYFTEPTGYDGSAPNGTVYRIDPAGKVSVFSQEITGPNGIVLSADGKLLYVSHNIAKDTTELVRWPLNPDGSAGKMEFVTKIEGCQADGMDIDQRGNLWLTCYSHGIAYSISPQGKLLEQITTAKKALTNAKFGRNGGQRWLYLTSSEMDRVTGYVYRVWVNSPGLR
jgi:gluconolactonase